MQRGDGEWLAIFAWKKIESERLWTDEAATLFRLDVSRVSCPEALANTVLRNNEGIMHSSTSERCSDESYRLEVRIRNI